jgi:DNA-binding NarL/FixJ family response regulator
MDLMMPIMDGLQAIAAIRRECPATQLLALTSYQDVALVRGALEAGAIGYLLKNSAADELVAAIRAARVGEPTVAVEVTRALIQAVAAPPPGDALTVREREVLALLARGLSNSQIGAELGLSSSTVKNHLSSIFAKLAVATRTEAAAFAIRHKLVPSA